ncbi:MAG: hypothetical protein ABSA34_03955 [Candidatus Goldiibacteriota bacterium]|jgi:hypothetical protein
MKKGNITVEMDHYIEKAVKRYCRENSISLEQFMEDAVLDRLEAGEDGLSAAAYEEEYPAGPGDNMIFDTEGDLYKKKH